MTENFVDAIFQFSPKQPAVSLDWRNELPSSALANPVPFDLMEAFRGNLDKSEDGGKSRTSTVSANAPSQGFASIDIDPEHYHFSFDGNFTCFDIKSGRILLESKPDQELRFEFAEPGYYLADFCMDGLDGRDATLTIIERRKWPKGSNGHLPFAERFSPCGNRLTFRFDVRTRMNCLEISLEGTEGRGAFCWAKFTKLREYEEWS